MEINEYLIKLIQTTKDMESLDLFPEASKLSKTEFRLLREIIMERERGNGIISSELSRRLGITRSAISQIVTKMEERGIVRRVASPTDRKIAYVQLSEASLALFEEQCAQANRLVERVTEEFGKERICALIEQYDELSAIVERVRKEMMEGK